MIYCHRRGGSVKNIVELFPEIRLKNPGSRLWLGGEQLAFQLQLHNEISSLPWLTVETNTNEENNVDNATARAQLYANYPGRGN